MADTAVIREWLNKAEEDLRFAEANLLEGNEFFAQTRYPVHWPTNYTKETAEQAHLAAVGIAGKVRSQLSL